MHHDVPLTIPDQVARLSSHHVDKKYVQFASEETCHSGKDNPVLYIGRTFIDVAQRDSQEEKISLSSRQMLHHVLYHAYNLWLFVFSDLKTIVIPSTVFGTCNAIAASNYGLAVPAHTGLSAPHTSQQILRTLFWVLMNLFPFSINNQRDPSAVAEDAINKPWRPIPSNRISDKQAKPLMLFLYIAAQVYSLVHSGGYRQSLGLVVLGTWYNNMGGADTNPLIRNLINALGYLCFITGAMEVALGFHTPLSPTKQLSQWLLVIAGIILSTVHAQDMYDQKGDAERGRKTVPIVIGDAAARWTIAVPMLGWGVLCPAFWHAHAVIYALSCVLAASVAVRTLLFRSVESDKATFRIWNCWVALVFVMPLWAGRLH